jgi:hypothetical protein
MINMGKECAGTESRYFHHEQSYFDQLKQYTKIREQWNLPFLNIIKMGKEYASGLLP